MSPCLILKEGELMQFRWLPKPPGILSWSLSLDRENQEGNSHDSGGWCGTIGVEVESSRPLDKWVVNELGTNRTGWREMARGGEGFPGLRSLCPKGKHPAEEAAQGRQLRLSLLRKGGCLTWALRMVPFPHLSTWEDACCNMPYGAIWASRAPCGSQGQFYQGLQGDMKPRQVSWGQMGTCPLHADAPAPGPLQSQWAVLHQTSKNNLLSSSRAQL